MIINFCDYEEELLKIPKVTIVPHRITIVDVLCLEQYTDFNTTMIRVRQYSYDAVELIMEIVEILDLPSWRYILFCYDSTRIPCFVNMHSNGSPIKTIVDRIGVFPHREKELSLRSITKPTIIQLRNLTVGFGGETRNYVGIITDVGYPDNVFDQLPDLRFVKHCDTYITRDGEPFNLERFVNSLKPQVKRVCQ